MAILQGDIYWVDFGDASGSKAAYLHPAVVVQHDSVNRSKIETVVVCQLTTTGKLANAPGNVQLFPGEGNLPEPSVVNVSLVTHVNKTDLLEKIGTLRPDQVGEILNGFRLIVEGRKVGS